MRTRLDILTGNALSHQSIRTQEPVQIKIRRRVSINALFMLISLTLAASIPRIILALQLDMVTDEVVYIRGGIKYISLLKHFPFNITSNEWLYNHEHPPFVKFLIGLSIKINTLSGHPLGDLLAARIPSIVVGTLLVLSVYCLGQAPFGRTVAFLAALCLAVSPWLVYFSALAYLDMTMTALITTAYLLLWHAIRHPWLYMLAAFLLCLAAVSKYTAALAFPGMLLFIAYYYLGIRPHLPTAQRPAIPWRLWLAIVILAPLTFILINPIVWPNPVGRLIESFNYEWAHAINGHRTFIAGQYGLHVPHWAIIYIICTKVSAFVTIPAAFFVLFALVQLIHFHIHRSYKDITRTTATAFLLIWLLSMLAMFSLLNIVVGTHYHLPLAAPVALAGAYGLSVLLRYRPGRVFSSHIPSTSGADRPIDFPTHPPIRKNRLQTREILTIALLAAALVLPHLWGLVTVHAAEGYTSEFFHDENTALQVAYPGYRDALQWVTAHSHGQVHVGLAAFENTLNGGGDGVSWYIYNRDLPARLQITEAHPDDPIFQYDYLIWPMHLLQRGYPIPKSWRVVHTIMGGNTVYCYITVRSITNFEGEALLESSLS